MNPDYQNLRSEADHLWNRFNDTVDNKDATRGLEQEMRAVVEDFEQGKKPRSIDDRVKRVIEELHQFTQKGSGSMDSGHVEELHRGFVELREKIRNLDNY